jgi:hypothetical protein
MTHATEKFKFVDVDGNVVEFESTPYSFDLEEKVLVNRFGKEKIEEFANTHALNFKIKLDHIKEDFPKLLQGDLSRIDFSKQSGEYYDELRRVYCFFLEYDSNAQLRLSEALKKTLASNIETLKTIMNSMPESILEAASGKNITSN